MSAKTPTIRPFRSIEEIHDAHPDFPIIAWGDESVRVKADPPMYLLGATVFLDDPFYLLEMLDRIKPKGAKKLHWRDLGVELQKESLEIIARIAHTTTIVIASPLISNKQERARRKCLQEMLIRLDQAHVDCLFLESRSDNQDRKDKDFLFYLQRSKTVTHIDISHIDGKTEIRTCIPDQILGAYVDAHLNNAAMTKWQQSWEKIRDSVTVYSVKP